MFFQRIQNKFVIFGLFFAISQLISSNAFGDYLSGATGHGTMKCPGSLKQCGLLHFAVLDRSNGKYGDTWATGFKNFDHLFERGIDMGHVGSSPLDYSAKYLYLYQVTNNTADYSLESARVPFYSSTNLLVTSWGSFGGLGFADDKKMTGKSEPVSATNPFGIPEGVGGKNLKVINPTIVSIAEGVDVGLNPHEVLLTEKALRAQWDAPLGIGAGRRSALFGFTSQYRPVFIKGNVVIKCGHAGEPVCPQK